MQIKLKLATRLDGWSQLPTINCCCRKQVHPNRLTLTVIWRKQNDLFTIFIFIIIFFLSVNFVAKVQLSSSFGKNLSFSLFLWPEPSSKDFCCVVERQRCMSVGAPLDIKRRRQSTFKHIKGFGRRVGGWAGGVCFFPPVDFCWAGQS